MIILLLQVFLLVASTALAKTSTDGVSRCGKFGESTSVWVKIEESGEAFLWRKCTLNLGGSSGIGADGIPTGSSDMVVDCEDKSVKLSYTDFIPGRRRRAIVDWDWNKETKIQDLMSCFTSMRADFPKATTPEDEVFIFGIMTLDPRLGRK